MKSTIRLALLFGLALGVGGVVLGTFGPRHAVRSSDSPYASVLSDYSVGTAEAVACNTHCYKVGHLWYCQNDIDPSGNFCHYALDHTSCTNDPCP
jgi:hypothetical protein